MARDVAAELRAARERFTFALANGLRIDEAKAEMARRRWAEADARLARRRCGTVVAPVEADQGERELQWWQR